MVDNPLTISYVLDLQEQFLSIANRLEKAASLAKYEGNPDLAEEIRQIGENCTRIQLDIFCVLLKAKPPSSCNSDISSEDVTIQNKLLQREEEDEDTIETT